ncbi:hypothetical protein B0H10DRAFT_2014870 [Mycena sp. CBHHK59/15]|nr:hypothetical protein B0H10DRAFT_2014870 [Mycena sp. CBHHK59/15]
MCWVVDTVRCDAEVRKCVMRCEESESVQGRGGLGGSLQAHNAIAHAPLRAEHAKAHAQAERVPLAAQRVLRALVRGRVARGLLLLRLVVVVVVERARGRVHGRGAQLADLRVVRVWRGRRIRRRGVGVVRVRVRRRGVRGEAARLGVAAVRREGERRRRRGAPLVLCVRQRVRRGARRGVAERVVVDLVVVDLVRGGGRQLPVRADGGRRRREAGVCAARAGGERGGAGDGKVVAELDGAGRRG